MTDALQVRPIGDADVAGVVDLLEQAHRHQLEQRDGEMWATVNAVPVTEERVRHRAEHGLVLVGTVLGVPVGVVVARHEVVSDKRLALIEELYTEPEARGVGVGRRLIQAVELWARATGCIGIESMALPGDRDTKNFFEAAGLIARAIVVHRSFEPTR
ncbi:MAG: GNAT family N-acetyltransferase [Candidatus Microthrix subdominans]|uniref:GNAT family N-acetyltransferase n=1 Tax=Candidatus Neomicrothrix subdominans TaxID=2954438 RepID=A0A936NF97_9ACTN|nr:GNAT family N-acetyltransferase [Candidatus Microthrix sp.]MBK9298313.1 GNAT family N-acetyltransferase [Candidatus Microthrix subdominans]MBK6309821.1 GNAT family N-acetyltransferase [Candidatus Microthrix sp.]MBK6438866.1 GNAT family N-acetyltransferase [Candidatus Microthrix sp.]MBK6968213.1 GNAT family N-acetyltransferase [Candidatus Microthrix sp.]MBK9559733.1 GNAT family N-acetyltransferase [Candidatus Microthrix sp.]